MRVQVLDLVDQDLLIYVRVATSESAHCFNLDQISPGLTLRAVEAKLESLREMRSAHGIKLANAKSDSARIRLNFEFERSISTEVGAILFGPSSEPNGLARLLSSIAPGSHVTLEIFCSNPYLSRIPWEVASQEEWPTPIGARQGFSVSRLAAVLAPPPPREIEPRPPFESRQILGGTSKTDAYCVNVISRLSCKIIHARTLQGATYVGRSLFVPPCPPLLAGFIGHSGPSGKGTKPTVRCAGFLKGERELFLEAPALLDVTGVPTHIFFLFACSALSPEHPALPPLAQSIVESGSPAVLGHAGNLPTHWAPALMLLLYAALQEPRPLGASVQRMRENLRNSLHTTSYAWWDIILYERMGSVRENMFLPDLTDWDPSDLEAVGTELLRSTVDAWDNAVRIIGRRTPLRVMQVLARRLGRRLRRNPRSTKEDWALTDRKVEYLLRKSTSKQGSR